MWADFGGTSGWPGLAVILTAEQRTCGGNCAGGSTRTTCPRLGPRSAVSSPGRELDKMSPGGPGPVTAPWASLLSESWKPSSGAEGCVALWVLPAPHAQDFS